MTDLNQNTFSSFNVFPKYVTDDTLKRARVDNNGLTSIRVSNTTEPTPTDLSTLENNTSAIKNTESAISTKIGNRNDAAWDGTSDASLIEIEKKTSGDTASIKTVVGSSSDTSSDSTVIGLLKSIASKLQ